MKKLHLIILLFGLDTPFFFSQLVTVDNSVIINRDLEVIIQNDGLNVASNGLFKNSGLIVIEGNIINEGLIDGNNDNTGVFEVQGNWINNQIFISDNSEVVLNGNDQIIGGTSVSDFYTLTLDNGGVKTMEINAKSHWLNLNHLELKTNDFVMEVHNNDPNAIDFTTGFVSSTNDGHLQRWTNSTQEYIFPVGSNVKTPRYRPIIITPNTTNQSIFGVRFANNLASQDGYLIANRGPLLENVNHLFYHHIYRNQGNSSADITFNYLPFEDGFAEAIGHWKGTKWYAQTNVNPGIGLNQFTQIVLQSQNEFNSRAFALANIKEFIHIPNAFSPNNDGINDVFTPFVNEEDVSEFSINIYDRWGQVVFSSEEPNTSWDGTHNGIELPLDVYVWKIRYKENNSLEIKIQQGHVTLVR